MCERVRQKWTQNAGSEGIIKEERKGKKEGISEIIVSQFIL